MVRRYPLWHAQVVLFDNDDSELLFLQERAVEAMASAVESGALACAQVN